MAAGPDELSVELQTGPDIDAEELAKLSGWLRAELLDLDVDDVQQPARGEAPEDSKGVGWSAAGDLVVRLVTSPELLVSLIGGVRSWLRRNRVRSVKLTLDGDTLEVSGMSSAEQDRLINLWVTRHATGA
jgi:Effector Associated Constant Component 1